MPLVYQHIINENSTIIVWKITEGVNFFSSHLNYDPDISHQEKRLQHLCGRYVLSQMIEGFALDDIFFNDFGKPIDKKGRCHFSISHSNDFVAVIVSKDRKVGIDMERINSKIKNIAPRFLDDSENVVLKNVFENEVLGLTVVWSIKEACFKWDGGGRVDFKKQMTISSISAREYECHAVVKLNNEDKCADPIEIKIQFMIFNQMVLSWVYA